MSLQTPRCMKCRREVDELSTTALPRGGLRVEVWCHGETDTIDLTREELADDVIPAVFGDALMQSLPEFKLPPKSGQ